MAEAVKDSKYTISEENGDEIIQIADDVVSSIVGLAVTEVDGVSKLTGDITREIISKLGKNNLSKGIRVTYGEDSVSVDVSVEIKYGYNIVEVSKNIQEKVKQSLLTMTGLECSVVNVKVSSIDFKE
ncbi:MAG: Asp23/Gls24 family envelope stress response protein [Eubacterium sp.]|nr:Asp23/Gls24 family envelope stress response protein [Eubacterium sp.]